MTDAPKPLSEQECEDIFEAGTGCCDEVSFARLRATVAALRAERDAALMEIQRVAGRHFSHLTWRPAYEEKRPTAQLVELFAHSGWADGDDGILHRTVSYAEADIIQDALRALGTNPIAAARLAGVKAGIAAALHEAGIVMVALNGEKIAERRAMLDRIRALDAQAVADERVP